IPFALVGGVVGLDVAGLNLSVSACIGFIALMGQVVLNGVVLVSQINALRAEGLGLRAAVEAGATRRLRAVLMTALLAALGLLPAARGEATVRLTLDEALAGLRRQNPELLAGALHVRAAHGDVITAGLLPNPTLSAGAGNFPLGRTNPGGLGVGDTVVSQVGLAEEVLLPGKRGARRAAAQGREEAAAAQRADLERPRAFEP